MFPAIQKKRKSAIAIYFWLLLGLFPVVVFARNYFRTSDARHEETWQHNLHTRERAPLPASALNLFDTPYQFTDQNGNAFSLSGMTGYYTVLDFIFTRCTMSCPMMTGRLLELQRTFPGEDRLRFISFTVDPVYDQPEILKAYAERFDADHARWRWLTGKKEGIYGLAKDYFSLSVGEVSEEDRNQGAETFFHSQRLVLVDPAGRILGYYDGSDTDGMTKLVSDLKTQLL